MFTGIVEELGTVVAVERGAESARLTVQGRVVTSDAVHGSSIAVNGVYLLFVIGPFIALFLVSFQDAWTGAFEFTRLTFANYYKVMFIDVTAKRGLFNSLIIATLGATIAVAVCMARCWAW